MSAQLRHKGKYIKQKVLKKKLKFVNQMREGKLKKKSEIESNLDDGRSVVELKELAKNLRCCQCKDRIYLENTKKEIHLGLNSVLWINCEKCNILTKVPTGKFHTKTNKTSNKKYSVSDVNTKVVMGCIDAGVGHTALNKILACCNIPEINQALYKRYEREVGPIIEKEAKQSCKRAAEEERKLILENIDKLCVELPIEIAEEIYPHYCKLHKSITSSSSTSVEIFDTNINDIISIIVSYDMGWSKRGNGKTYDSLNGYGCIIGFLSGKILDFATRNRKCNMCDAGHPKTDHDCRKNFQGSAKAMEPSVGAELVVDSEILKESNLKARVVIGDEDSSTIASIRNKTTEKIFKLADRNHLRKAFVNDLYAIQKNFKEMRQKGAILHLKKCFSYAVIQNKGKSERLAATLCSIPDHVFNQHENCGSWCHHHSSENSIPQTIIFKDPDLHVTLTQIFSKYAKNAYKFSVAASSEGNESVNNVMGHKSPKINCYSRSESSDFRYASTVCTVNDGESHLINVEKGLLLSPAKRLKKFARKKDSVRTRRATKAKLPVTKLRRNILAQNREQLRKKNENSEGMQYKSNCGFSSNEINTNFNLEDQIKHINFTKMDISPETCNVVYFDLETSGLRRSDEILQIAAKFEDQEFSVYITPTKEISQEASEKTGLRIIGGQLYLKNIRLLTIPLYNALVSFSEFLSYSQKPCVLVAHNVKFDASFLIRALSSTNMIEHFQIIAGFSDTLPLFKKKLSQRKGEGMFKLNTLARDFLEIKSDDNFHEALYDVQTLAELSSLLIESKKLFSSTVSFVDAIYNQIRLRRIATIRPSLQPLDKVVSNGMLKKIAGENITYDILKEQFNTQGETGIRALMSEKLENGKPRITKNPRILKNIINFLGSEKSKEV